MVRLKQAYPVSYYQVVVVSGRLLPGAKIYLSVG